MVVDVGVVLVLTHGSREVVQRLRLFARLHDEAATLDERTAANLANMNEYTAANVANMNEHTAMNLANINEYTAAHPPDMNDRTEHE